MIATNKDELINDINSTYKKLRSEFNNISLEKALDKSLDWQVKGTKMSLHNLLSYLVGWWELMLKREHIYSTESRIPDLPDTGYTMNDWWKLALKFYSDYEEYDYEVLLDKFDKVVFDIITMLSSLDNEKIYWESWYVTKSSWKWYTFWRMIALNTSSPYKNAYWRIRKWKKLI